MDKQITTLEEQKGAKRRRGNIEEIKVFFANGFTQHKPYVVSCDKDGLVAIAPATSAVPRYVVVPQGATTIFAGWYWAQLVGPSKMLVDGTTAVAAGDFLEVLNEGVAAVKDGASQSVGSVAVAKEAQAEAAAVAIAVELLGLPAQIAAA